MSRILSFALLVFATASSALAATSPSDIEYSIQLTGDIEVAPDGSVHAYTLDEGLKPVVEKLVSANIESWKFQPILVDGRPVIARTRLRMMLKAVPAAEGYALEVGNVWFGEPTRKSQLTPPRYPKAAAREGIGARVVLVLRLDAQGEVADLHVEQTSLSKEVGGKTGDRWRRMFEKATVASASEWKFDVSEIIDGAPAESSSVRVPVDFMMGDKRVVWQGIVPGPVVPAPWVDQQPSLATSPDDLGAGDMQPLDSRFRLQTQVVGMVL